LAYPEVRAAAQGAPPTPPEAKPAAPEAKPTTEGEGTKPEGAAPAAPPATPETGAADGEPVPLGDLMRDGFEIRATDFIPAEAVTRHSGKVSSDAIVVTLQKTTATAICFYTLKAYVGKTLITIPACTVHR
jgi:hypothetical protein